MKKKRLCLDEENGEIWGVCAGIGGYFNIDIDLIRLIFFLMLILGKHGFEIYFIAFIFLWLNTQEKE